MFATFVDTAWELVWNFFGTVLGIGEGGNFWGRLWNFGGTVGFLFKTIRLEFVLELFWELLGDLLGAVGELLGNFWGTF